MRRQAFDVLVVGPVARDQLFVTKAEKLGYGDTLDVNEVPITLAGSGANIAVGLARLGVKVGLVSAVGRDSHGDAVVKELSAEGVDTQLVARVSLAETGLGVTVLHDGAVKAPFVLRYQGANTLIEVTEEVQKTLHTTQWLYVTKCSPAWESQLALLLEALAHEPTRLAWHPGSSEALQWAPRSGGALFARTDILFLNEEEAQSLSGAVSGHDTLERTFAGRGVKTVVMSHGDQEAHLLSGQVHLSAPPPQAHIRDPRGAGDAFRAGFLAGMVHQAGDLTLSLQWALTNAASVVGSLTTQRGLLARTTLEERLRAQRIVVEKSTIKE